MVEVALYLVAAWAGMSIYPLTLWAALLTAAWLLRTSRRPPKR